MRVSDVSDTKGAESPPEASFLPSPAVVRAIEDIEARFFVIDRVISHLRACIHDVRTTTAAGPTAAALQPHAKAAHACVEDLRQEFGLLAADFIEMGKELGRGGQS